MLSAQKIFIPAERPASSGEDIAIFCGWRFLSADDVPCRGLSPDISDLSADESCRHHMALQDLMVVCGWRQKTCLLTAVNCFSVRWAMRIQGLFTSAKLLALVTIVIAGIVHMSTGHRSTFNGAFDGDYDIRNVALAFYSGLFAFGGWNFLNFVTEELQDPYNTPERDSNIDLSVVGSLVYFESSALYHVATEAGKSKVEKRLMIALGPLYVIQVALLVKILFWFPPTSLLSLLPGRAQTRSKHSYSYQGNGGDSPFGKITYGSIQESNPGPQDSFRISVGCFRNLPRAIWIAMPIVTLVYVTANLAYFAVLTSDEMLTSTAVAVWLFNSDKIDSHLHTAIAVVSRQFQWLFNSEKKIPSSVVSVTFGDKMFGSMSWTVPVFVALSTFGGVNGILFTSARLFLVGSQEGQLPSVFSYIHIRKFTPVPSLLFTCGMSLLMLCSSDVFVLINYFSQILWLSTAACIVALLYLRRSQPDIPRPIKVNLVLPVTFLICCAFLAVVPAIADPLSTVIGLAITISGVPVYYVFIKWKGKPESYTKMLHEITSTLQAVLEVVSPEEGEKFLGPTDT
uniref:Amino acid permease/ SLC12A domain-containing protein n=1 Tax=Timema bartmani TaxID=61472 RepID=A0A7R9ES74_9NEOP|nr:unnamed protein product [Timema bartmani]